MNEENNGTPKNKWSRIFRKKWFFPAVYLTIAALLLSLVVWYQNLGSQIDESQEEEYTEDYAPIEHEEDAQPVMEQQEVVQRPVENMDQAEIVTKYYDYNADQEDQENAIVVFNDRYYQSTGIDIASADGETFDVLASLSGTVTEVKEDPLLGNVVTLTHENDVTTHYASLQDVQISVDDSVAQGDVIGAAGKNLFGKDNGTHLHFEIRKDGEDVNPESFFNQPLSELDSAGTESEETESVNEASDGSEHENTESEASEEGNDEEATEEDNAAEDSESNQEEDGTSEDSETDDEEDSATEDDEDSTTEDDESSNDQSNEEQ